MSICALIGKQQVAIGLLGVGLLRVLVDDDAAVKDAVRAAVENAVVELAAAAVRAGVLDQHVVVEMLAAVADEQAVDQALAAFAGQHRMHVVAHQRAAEQHGVRGDIGAAALLDAQRGDVEGLRVFALDHVVRNDRVVAGDQFGRGVAEAPERRPAKRILRRP